MGPEEREERGLPEPYCQDFRNFLWAGFRHLGLPEPTVLQYDLAHWLQHGPDRQCNEAFRSFGKSWITSFYVLFCLDHDPDERLLIVSGGRERADDFTTFTLMLLHDWEPVSYLCPRDDSLRASKVSFDVSPARPAHAPSVKSVGITGQMTGSKANRIIGDDVETASNSDTQLKREKLAHRVTEFSQILLPGGQIVMLGTPQTEDSIYSLLPDRGYTTRIWPARYPTKSQLSTYGNSLAPVIQEKAKEKAGEPTEPLRFDEEQLQKQELEGRSVFALQWMLDTSLSDAERYPLKLSDLVVYDLDTERAPWGRAQWAKDPEKQIRELPNVGMRGDGFYWPLRTEGESLPYETGLLAVDPAGRGGDMTAYAVLKVSCGYVFLLEKGELAGGYEDTTLEHLARAAQRHGLSRALVESNFGDGMFQKLWAPFLREIHPVSVEEVRSSTQKELRIIQALEPVMNRHRLVVDRRVVQSDLEPRKGLSPDESITHRLFHQMTRVTKTKGCLAHDDALDALAMGVQALHSQLALDPMQRNQDRRNERLQEEIRKFVARARGMPLRQPNWTDSHSQAESLFR